MKRTCPESSPVSSSQNCSAVGSGGAINANTGITIINGIFINSTSGQSGGAVFSEDVLTLVGSSFIGSYAGGSGNGGAVYASDVTNVSTTSFVDSSAATGGAIYAATDISVSGSSFANSTARQLHGGALYAVPPALIAVTNSVFSVAYAASAGGSIYGADNIVVTGSNFTSSAAQRGGGAIFASQNLMVQSCNFALCSSQQSGGAVSALNYATFSGSTVSYSSAAVSGGGLFAGTTLTVNSSRFVGAFSLNSGGAIYASDFLTVTNSAFVNSSTAQGSGGAVFGTSMVVSTTSFSNTTAQGGLGGGLYVNGGRCVVSQCAFTGSTSAQDGGGIFITSGGSLALERSQFTSCISTSGNGGAIATTLPTAPGATSPVSVTIDSSNFTGCRAPLGTGGAISSCNVLLSSSSLSSNSALNGGAVGMSTFFSYLQDYSNSFLRNSARLAGGAVYTPCWFCTGGQAVVMSNNSIFTGNVANGLTPHGGALAAFRMTVTIVNGSFTANQASFLLSASVNDQIPATTFGQLSGGAIFLYAPVALNVSASSFVSNSAVQGGAACVTGDGTGGIVDFSDSLFELNTASGTNGGGAISCELIRTAVVTTSKFILNSAVRGQGGAINMGSIGTSALVDTCNFTTNTAFSAGAVFFAGITGVPKLTNSVATSNRCAPAPQFTSWLAVCWLDAHLAHASPTARFSPRRLRRAAVAGGVIVADDTAVDLTLSKFFDNSAGQNGGVAYFRRIGMPSLSVQDLISSCTLDGFGTNCTMIGNTATRWGSVLSLDIVSLGVKATQVTRPGVGFLSFLTLYDGARFSSQYRPSALLCNTGRT